MKKRVQLSIIFLFISLMAVAQEKYGRVFNLGLGIGYYGYTNTMLVPHFNYEFDVAPNFTLAPFMSIYSHRRTYKWNGPGGNGNNYGYRERAIPLGVKGSYYLDKALNAGPSWDFYLAGSLGFVARTYTWDDGYNGDRNLDNSPLFLNIHFGVEYHITPKTGLFLDLSNGASTIGLAFHH